MARENTIPFALPGFAIDGVDEHDDVLIVHAHSPRLLPYARIVVILPAAFIVITPDHRAIYHALGANTLDSGCAPFSLPHTACTHKTFAERIPQLVPVHGQRTARLTSVLHAIAFELSAEAGVRVAHL